MKLPSSDRFWLYGIIAFASVLIISAGVTAVKVWRGDFEPPPEYENAPAVKLAAPDESGIADLANADRPPISDEDFKAIRSGTRVLISRLARGDLRMLRSLTIERSVAADAERELRDIRAAVGDAKLSEPRDIYLTRPVNDKAQSGGRIAAAALNQDGTSDQASVTFTFFWVRSDGVWKLFGVVPELNASPGATPDGADGVEGSADEAPSPADDNPSSSGDGVDSEALDSLSFP
jgi:hypothetical protein